MTHIELSGKNSAVTKDELKMSGEKQVVGGGWLLCVLGGRVGMWGTSSLAAREGRHWLPYRLAQTWSRKAGKGGVGPKSSYTHPY